MQKSPDPCMCYQVSGLSWLEYTIRTALNIFCSGKIPLQHFWFLHLLPGFTSSDALDLPGRSLNPRPLNLFGAQSTLTAADRNTLLHCFPIGPFAPTSSRVHSRWLCNHGLALFCFHWTCTLPEVSRYVGLYTHNTREYLHLDQPYACTVFSYSARISSKRIKFSCSRSNAFACT